MATLVENPFYGVLHVRDFMIKTHRVKNLTDAMADAARILRSRECRHLWDEEVRVEFLFVTLFNGEDVCREVTWRDEDITLALSRHGKSSDNVLA